MQKEIRKGQVKLSCMFSRVLSSAERRSKGSWKAGARADQSRAHKMQEAERGSECKQMRPG